MAAMAAMLLGGPGLGFLGSATLVAAALGKLGLTRSIVFGGGGDLQVHRTKTFSLAAMRRAG